MGLVQRKSYLMTSHRIAATCPPLLLSGYRTVVLHQRAGRWFAGFARSLGRAAGDRRFCAVDSHRPKACIAEQELRDTAGTETDERSGCCLSMMYATRRPESHIDSLCPRMESIKSWGALSRHFQRLAAV